ncbi:MAG: hypothetical protein U9N31_09250 [Candidatus Marinimicrobia bacterium]|nr:hypothetical protein [Candidatus Neomarinimicrobiota bacterium]
MLLKVIPSFLLLSLLWGNSSQKFYPNPEPNARWSIRFYGGYATHRPLLAIITLGDIRPEYHQTGIHGLDLSRVIAKDWKGYSLDWSIRLGYIRHNENGFQSDHNQYNLFLTAHYKTHFRGFPMRWFIGEGLSWSERVPYVEGRETRRLSEERDSQLMNYINVGFDFNLGDVLKQPGLAQVTVGFADSHRSGIYKKVQWFNRTQGGSNFITLFMEYKF